MRTGLKILCIAAPVLVALPQKTPAQQSDTKSVLDGVYTEAQARRGEALNENVCSACHMEDWFTQVVLQPWSGSPLSFLYELISTTMPEDRPGTLKPQEYADVLAYIFELNGLPPGQEELTATKESLDKIIIEQRR